jgi:chorismate synthase
VRGYLKPFSTLRRPLASVDFSTREPVKRSDVCVVPAAGWPLNLWSRSHWRGPLGRFGGDSMVGSGATAGYLEQLRTTGPESGMIYPS